jgi:hypothetical protein
MLALPLDDEESWYSIDNIEEVAREWNQHQTDISCGKPEAHRCFEEYIAKQKDFIHQISQVNPPACDGV